MVTAWVAVVVPGAAILAPGPAAVVAGLALLAADVAGLDVAAVMAGLGDRRPDRVVRGRRGGRRGAGRRGDQRRRRSGGGEAGRECDPACTGVSGHISSPSSVGSRGTSLTVGEAGLGPGYGMERDG